MYQCFFTAVVSPAHGAAQPGEPPRAYAAEAETPRPYAAEAETPRPYAAEAETPRAYAAEAETPRHYTAEAEPLRVIGNALGLPEVAAGMNASVHAGSAARRLAGAALAGAGDFDFLHGQWLVENRRVEEPLGPSPGGIVFDSVHTCRALWSGGHLEETTSEDGVTGAVLRLFDAHSRHWTIYRIAADRGTFETPLRGGFENGAGTFVGEGSWRGHPVLVRETWTRVAEKPRWEQAFSSDGGHTWSTHWIRDFIRVDWPQ